LLASDQAGKQDCHGPEAGKYGKHSVPHNPEGDQHDVFRCGHISQPLKTASISSLIFLEPNRDWNGPISANERRRMQ
jgi:hypothetical protein